MKKFSALFLSLFLILTIVSPASFAAVDTTFSVDYSLETDDHYPGVLYEYYYNPTADTDDVSMSLSITSGSKYIKNRSFKKDDDTYVLSFNVYDAIQDVEEIEYKVTCRDRSDSANTQDYTGKFYVGFGSGNYINSDADLDILNNSPIYEFDDNVNECTLNFDNSSYYKANFDDDIKLSLYYSTEVNSDLVNNNSANIEFMNFTSKPTFDRDGVFYYYAPNYKYLYTYNDGILKLLSNAKNGDYFRFTTKTLEYYVASDKPLSGVVTTSDSSSSSSSQGSAFSDVTSSSSSSKAVLPASTSKAASSSSKAATVVSSSKPVVSSSSSVVSSSSSSSIVSSSSSSTSSTSAAASSSSTSVESSSSSQATDAKPETTRKNGSNIILIIGAVIATVGVVSLTAALLTKKK